MSISFKRFLLLVFIMLAASVVSAQPPMSVEKADKLGNEAYDLLQQGKYEVAVAIYERILPVLERDTTQLRTWTFHALDYSLGFIRLEKYEQAIEILDHIEKRNGGGFKPWLGAWYYNYRARAVKGMGHLSQSLELSRRAVAEMQKADDPGSLSTMLNNYSLSLKDAGKFTLAIETIQKSIQVLEINENTSKRVLAIRYNNLATIYEQLSLFDQALRYTEKSLALRQELGNPELLYVIHGNIGNIYKKMDNLEQALVHHHKSLEYLENIEHPGNLARAYTNLGALYIEIRDYQKARFYLNKSLQLRSGLENKNVLASSYEWLSSLYKIDGKLDTARYYMQKAMDIYRKQHYKIDQFATTITLSNLYKASGLYDEAFSEARNSMELAETLEATHYTAKALQQMGYVMLAKKDYEAASRYLEQARDKAETLPPGQRVDILIGLAKSYYQTEPARSFAVAHEAIHYIEQIRKRSGFTAEMRASVFTQYVDFYNLVAGWHIQQQFEMEQALRLIELTKARAFNEDLAVAASDYESQLPDSARLKKQELTYNLEQLYAQYNRTVSEIKRAEVKASIIETETAYEAFLNSLNQGTLFHPLTAYRPSVKVDELQAGLPQKTGVIEYALTDSALMIITLSRNSYEGHYLPFPSSGFTHQKDLSAKIKKYLNAINNKVSIPELNSLSAGIAQLLLEPVSAFIHNHNNLIIIPDGALAYLPFEALRFNKKYLITQNTIKYLPSLHTLNHLHKAQKPHSKELFILAGAQFEGPVSFEATRKNQFSSLPYTLIEVDSIAALFNENATVWKQGKASESRFKQASLDGYKYIHLATHGVINENRAEQSGLILQSENVENGRIDDEGFLRTSEIFQLKLNADMVVLSACNTARGELVKGEGIMGIQRAFFTAGASSLVVSLWSVYDRSTAMMMPDFYRNIRALESSFDFSWDSFLRWFGWNKTIEYGYKAEAMQQTKLNMLEHPLYKHPVYWAPFILIGS